MVGEGDGTRTDEADLPQPPLARQIVVAEEFGRGLRFATDERLQIPGLILPLTSVHSLHPFEHELRDKIRHAIALELKVRFIRNCRIRHVLAVDLRENPRDVGEGNRRITGQGVSLVFMPVFAQDRGMRRRQIVAGSRANFPVPAGTRIPVSCAFVPM